MGKLESILVITTSREEELQISGTFNAENVVVRSLSTPFDFVVEDYLTEQLLNITFRPTHILLDLEIGYQPAFSIISVLKRHLLTGHLPIIVFSQFESKCVLQRMEEAGVDAYLVRSTNWQYLTRELVIAYQNREYREHSGQSFAA